jgi:hypothetical protein
MFAQESQVKLLNPPTSTIIYNNISFDAALRNCSNKKKIFNIKKFKLKKLFGVVIKLDLICQF